MKTELKDKLISKIRGFEDQEILEEIYSWLEDESAKKIYTTTEAQRTAINEGLQQMERGQILSQKNADKEIDQWLKSID